MKRRLGRAMATTTAVMLTLSTQALVWGATPAAEAATTFTDINPDTSDLDPSDPDGSAGGRVNGIATQADDDQVAYAATEWGGLAKTTDGGLNWSRLDKHLPTAMWDVATDPQNTGRVFATSFFDGREASLAGINVSQDGGATWAHPATATPPGSLNCNADRVDEPSAFGIGIGALLASQNPQVVIGTNCGVARSTDGGATWTFSNPAAPAAPGNIFDVVVQPASPVNPMGIIDVCGDGGHFRSTTGGQTWTAGGAIPTGRCSIAVSPDESYVVLVLASDNRLYESDNGGGAWTNLGFPDPRGGGRIPFVIANQRTGATFDIWSGGVSLYRGTCTTPAVPAPGGSARCPAATTTATPTAPATLPAGWAGPFTRSTGAHDDVGDIEFDTEPNAGTDACPVLFSSDGGMYRNTDGGGDCHNPDWEQANAGLHDTWLWAMGGAQQAGASAEDLYFGLQDSGSWASTDAGAASPTWSNKDCCDIFDIAADPNRVLYTFCCAGAGGRRTTAILRNAGMTGGGQINTYPAGGLLPGFNFPDIMDTFGDGKFVMLTVDCTNPSADGVDNNGNGTVDDEPSNGCPVVTAGGSDGGVFVTDDITANPIVWTELGNGSEPDSTQYCDVQTAVPSATPNSPTFYVGIGNCRGEGSGSQYFKYTGTAPGGTWERIDDNDGLTGGFGILAVDPNDPNRLYASNLDSGGPQMVFSRDGGATWENDTELDSFMTGNGTFEYVNQRGPTQFTGFGGYTQPSLVAFDPEDPNIIVAGGRDSGVFVSGDAGETWNLLTDPFTSGTSGTPHLPRPWFAYFDHEPAGEVNVYVGTQGRGVWRLNLPTADLSITKTGPAEVNAGDDLTYTIHVTNNGPEAADEVKVLDTLPEQATFVTSAPAVCTEGPTDTLQCPLGDLAVGQTVQLDITVDIDPDTVSEPPVGDKGITNTASVRSGSVDPNPADNTASKSTTVHDLADLVVTKVSNPDNTVQAGQSFEWTINVDNNGPSHAREVVLTDTILSDTSAYVMGAPSSSQGSCTTTGTSSFTCNLGLLPEGERATVTVQVTSAEGGTFQDEAVVDSDTPDPDDSNNRAVDFITVQSLAGLSVTKLDNPDPVVAGENVTYTVGITNSGPSAAVNVVANDFLPAQVKIVSVSSTGASSCQAGVPGDDDLPTTCTYGTLPNGATRQMTIVATVHPDTLGLIHNDAEVTSDTFDPDNSDDKATEETTVVARADLVVDKNDSPDPVQAGRKLTYELKVFNAGPSTAVAVEVEDLLPDEVDFDKVTISNGTGTCVLEEVDPAPPTKKLTCQLGDMRPNPASPVFIHIDTIVKPDTPHNTVISNTANVSSSTADPDPSDNSSTETTTVQGVANLAIVKTSDKDTYRPSETIKYTVTVANNGPSDAVNVVVTDNLPPTKQATYEFDTAGCTVSGLTLTCSLGTITTGSSKSFNIYFIVRGRKGEVSNTASVTSDLFDPVLANNTSTRTVLIKNI